MAQSNAILKAQWAGIDGCRGGWIIAYSDQHSIIVNWIGSLHELKALGIRSCLIDMPIGLSAERHIDQDLRQVLKPVRHHSVFSTPVRAAVYSDEYVLAKSINKEATGKSISIQSWNICPKIKEVDLFIQDTSNDFTAIESHPEYCFYRLNQNKHLQHKKSTPAGVDERIKLLHTYKAEYTKAFELALKSFPRKVVKADDILDALCLHLTGQHELGYIKNEPIKDEKGITMQIAFPSLY